MYRRCEWVQDSIRPECGFVVGMWNSRDHMHVHSKGTDNLRKVGVGGATGEEAGPKRRKAWTRRAGTDRRQKRRRAGCGAGGKERIQTSEPDPGHTDRMVGNFVWAERAGRAGKPH